MAIKSKNPTEAPIVMPIIIKIMPFSSEAIFFPPYNHFRTSE
jgi:hypothetical protein